MIQEGASDRAEEELHETDQEPPHREEKEIGETISDSQQIGEATDSKSNLEHKHLASDQSDSCLGEITHHPENKSEEEPFEGGTVVKSADDDKRTNMNVKTMGNGNNSNTTMAKEENMVKPFGQCGDDGLNLSGQGDAYLSDGGLTGDEKRDSSTSSSGAFNHQFSSLTPSHHIHSQFPPTPSSITPEPSSSSERLLRRKRRSINLSIPQELWNRNKSSMSDTSSNADFPLLHSKYGLSSQSKLKYTIIMSEGSPMMLV